MEFGCDNYAKNSGDEEEGQGSLLRRAKAGHCVTGPSRGGQFVTHTLLANARFTGVSSLLLGESNLNLGLDGA